MTFIGWSSENASREFPLTSEGHGWGLYLFTGEPTDMRRA
jgi:hypothetical protein